MQISYAGIGSRETPEHILKFFKYVGNYLGKKNIILRSGGADGADLAFEYGTDVCSGQKEIYLPWKNFNNSKSTYILNDTEAYEIAKQFHPYWENLKPGAKKLQARNSYQILGWDLNTPVDFVLCYTKGGNEIGGTAQAIRIAKSLNIPILNFGDFDGTYKIEDCGKFLFKKLIKFLNERNFIKRT